MIARGFAKKQKKVFENLKNPQKPIGLFKNPQKPLMIMIMVMIMIMTMTMMITRKISIVRIHMVCNGLQWFAMLCTAHALPMQCFATDTDTETENIEMLYLPRTGEGDRPADGRSRRRVRRGSLIQYFSRTQPCFRSKKVQKTGAYMKGQRCGIIGAQGKTFFRKDVET